MLGINIAMGHYGVGHKDGVNTVISRNIRGVLRDLKKDIHVTLFGACSDNIDTFISNLHERNVGYIDLPEFASGFNNRKINDQKPIEYMYEGEMIADKLAELLKDYDLVMMENTTVGNHPAVSYGLYIYCKWCMNHDVNKRFIFRTHDFMQDRPVNFANVKKFQPRRSRFVPDWHGIFYPNLPNIYYMAINTASMKELYSHGIDDETIYYLPNSIDDNLQVPDERYKGLRTAINEKYGVDPDAKIVYYPVRCVPRKNVEEAILITALLNRIADKKTGLNKGGHVSGKYHLMISLDNNDPKTGVYAQKIKQYVKEQNLPVTVGFGDILNLNRKYDEEGNVVEYGIADAYGISDIVITTSILEGFGFVYIEPWIVDCMVIGRDLPMVTRDFEKLGGMELGHLYNILVTDGVDFRDMGMAPDLLGTGYNSLNLDALTKKFDFIKRLRTDDEVLSTFIEANSLHLDPMFSVLDSDRTDRLVKHNKDAVMRNYSREVVSQRFYEIILEVMTRQA